LGEFQKRIKIVCTEVGFDDHFNQLMRIVKEAKKEFPTQILVNADNPITEQRLINKLQEMWSWFERWFS